MGDLSTRIKAKYPQYQGVPDDQLEQMIVKKYPQYQSMVQPKQNIVDKAVNSNFIPGLTSTIGSIAGMPGGLLGSAAGAGAGQAVGMGLQNSAQRLTDPNVSTRDKLLMAAKAAPGFISGGIPGAIGSLSGQGAAQLDPREVASKSAGVAATDLLFGSAGGLLGKIGKKVFSWGLNIPTVVVDRQTKERVARKIAEKAGKTGFGEDVVEGMLKRGIRGSADSWMVSAKEGAEESWKKVMSIANKASKQADGIVEYGVKTPGKKVIMDMDELREPFIKKLYDIPEGFIEDAGSGFQKVWDEMMKKRGKGLSLMDLVEINKNANDKLFTAAGNKTTSDAAKVRAYEAIDEVIKPYLKKNYPEISKALEEYGFNKQIEAIGLFTNRTRSRPPSNILQTVNAPFKALRNPGATTWTGAALNNASKLLPKQITAPLGAYLGSQSE